MANNLKLADAAVNAEADALSDQLDGGYLRIYDDTAPGQPATADIAVTTQVLLAELRFANPASGAAVAGVLTFSAITKDGSAKVVAAPQGFAGKATYSTEARDMRDLRDLLALMDIAA